MQNRSAEKNHAHRSAAMSAAALIVSGLLATSSSTLAQSASLGASDSFAILGASTVTNSGTTIITGNLGLSPGSSVTGFPPGVVINKAIHISKALANQAHADAFTAYTKLTGETPTGNLTGMDLSGLTLMAGVYRFNSSAQLMGTLTLNTGGNANAPFHFLIGSALTTTTNSMVVLLGGTDNNVFWQVGRSNYNSIGASGGFSFSF
jgi:hypothetical protein